MNPLLKKIEKLILSFLWTFREWIFLEVKFSKERKKKSTVDYLPFTWQIVISNQHNKNNRLYKDNKKDWLIDFNGMSTRLELFYAERLGNHVHLHSLCSCFLRDLFFAHGPTKYE